MKKKLLLLVNSDDFFISHRLEIGLSALKEGFDVYIASSINKENNILKKYGFKTQHIDLDRSSTSLFSNTMYFIKVFKIFLKIQPDIIHLITIKPVIFGGLAARLLGIKSVIVAISGLGYIFISKGLIARLRLFFVKFLYRLALNNKNVQLIFQNNSDKKIILDICNVDKSRTHLIKGSGVDLNKFKYTPLPKGVPSILFASRLLYDKGLKEFISAAELIKKDGYEGKFIIVGKPDNHNPASISLDQLKSHVSNGYIDWQGFKEDIYPLLKDSYLIVLPSYREGLPKILIEAAACGRPVVTTDVPGCRDAIIKGKTGLLVPPKNHVALAEAIKDLIENFTKSETLGLEARKFAEKNFDIKDVVSKHMQIYRSIF